MSNILTLGLLHRQSLAVPIYLVRKATTRVIQFSLEEACMEWNYSSVQVIDILDFGRPSVAVLATSAVIYISYLAGLVFYRLYLSPLSKFPGPKLAIIAKWYEFYYDVVLRGQYTLQIQRMHKTYGPIVRINPFELHIEDSVYWDELYLRHKEYERYEWMSGRFGANTTTSSTVKSDLHAVRSAPLNPMFSKRSITKLEPVIKEKVELLSQKLAAFKDTAKVIVMNNAFNAFSDNFHSAYEAVRKFAHLGLQFPVMFIVMGLTPSWLMKLPTPNIHKNDGTAKSKFAAESAANKIFTDPKKNLASRITGIMNGKDQTYADSPHPTILSELLESDLPPQEKTLRCLGGEAQQLIGAGLETMSWAMTTAVFHLLNNPAILETLRTELEEAIPDPGDIPDSLHLEKLPYLSGCIKEGIRLSTGVSVRLPRISREKPMKYRDWVIPAGTPVSMTTLDVLYDDDVYPNPNVFVPERWLNNPETSNGDALARYFVPFGKGSRMCIGVNLAYVEMYFGLATLFRRFTFELYETDITDIEIKHDFFVPSPKLDTKGLRVKIKSVVSQS
ncbi:putative cytochrome P450 [Xylariaceae sp. FL1272]|nr:putative cytochrome P450 [Xylariaceae sp. FL1272]